MNRGIARRTIFETRSDMERFLELLAQASQRGEIEVHAYALLTTHYHLLVRSPIGALSAAMQRVQTAYSRAFNRGRRRDGPLVRGRFASKEIRSRLYRRTVVRYIDRNPVAAGIVRRAADYPYGSARLYAGGSSEGAPWLHRAWVEGEVCERLQLSLFDPHRYHEAFACIPAELARLVERRLHAKPTADPIEDLVRAAPRRVLGWMRRKAALADGTRPGLPVLTPEAVEAAIQADSTEWGPEWSLGRRSGWKILQVGLARQLCGLGLEEIGVRVGLGQSAISSINALHARLLEEDSEYARRAGRVASRALRMWEEGEK